VIEALDYLLLFAGFVYLLLGGDLLVRGALAWSRRSAISPLVIGLTVVAFGTSAPELLVTLYSAVSGYPGVAIGNVVGSNIANVLLVVGVPALIQPVISQDANMLRQAIFMVAVSLVFVVMCLAGYIGQFDGWLLLGVLATAAMLTVRGHFAMPGVAVDQSQLPRVLGMPDTVTTISVFILLGCALLPLGADLAVRGAVAVAANLDVSDAAIGSTFVALGTSLPELSTTVIAAFHRNAEIALGNVIGSNVLNILAIMGITGVIVDVPVPESFLEWDIWVMLGSSVLLAGYVLLRRPIGRWSGIGFLAVYAGYYAITL
jgi:cation:H+ antiporter